jgi:hypothetical protein
MCLTWRDFATPKSLGSGQGHEPEQSLDPIDLGLSARADRGQ